MLVHRLVHTQFLFIYFKVGMELELRRAESGRIGSGRPEPDLSFLLQSAFKVIFPLPNQILNNPQVTCVIIFIATCDLQL